MIPEVQLEKAKRDLIKYQIQDTKSMNKTSSEEECLELMMQMKIGEEEGREPKDPGSSLSEQIQKITIGAGVELAEKIILPPGGSSRRGKKLKSGRQRTIMKTILEETADLEGLEDDDISFCDDWDILQEEDFQSEADEKSARLQLAEIEEALMKQYFASAEAKTEEKEMIEELERIEKEQQEGEPQTVTSILQEDQRKKETDIQEIISKSSNKKTPSPPKKKRMKLQTACDIGSSPALRKTTKKQKMEDKILQKMTPSPTKKITKSPHLPSARKKSPTITKKIKPTMIPCPDFKLQKLHLELGNNSKDGNGTKVKVARMKIEEKLRKEKRAKQLEKIRKPLVNTPGTPGSKRARNAEEVWEETAANNSKEEQQELPAKPVRGGWDTATCTGGVVYVEEHVQCDQMKISETDPYESRSEQNDYKRGADVQKPAMGEGGAIQEPAMGRGVAINSLVLGLSRGEDELKARKSNEAETCEPIYRPALGVGRAIHSPTMGEGQATHSLAMSEGESGQTVQTGMTEAATYAGTHRPARGESQAIESPAMGESWATWSSDRGVGESEQSAEADIFGGRGEQNEGSAVHTTTVESQTAATALGRCGHLSLRKTQTLMTSFTSKQSLEEKRSVINLQSAKAKKKKETAMGEKDMSSSFLFSTGKQRDLERNLEDAARPDHSHKTSKRNRRVLDIAKYFEPGMGGSRKDASTQKIDNNTAVHKADKVPVAATPNNRQITGLGQSGTQPMRSQDLSHVTENGTLQPIRHQKSQRNQPPDQGSHL